MWLFTSELTEHLAKKKQCLCVRLLIQFLFVSPQSYSEPVDVKSAQPPQLINAKPPSVFPGPSQAHSALYLSSHYHQQPGMNPHLTAMHPSLPRSIAPKANNQMPVTVSIANMAVSPLLPSSSAPLFTSISTCSSTSHSPCSSPWGPSSPCRSSPPYTPPPCSRYVQAGPWAPLQRCWGICSSGGLAGGSILLCKWRENGRSSANTCFLKINLQGWVRQPRRITTASFIIPDFFPTVPIFLVTLPVFCLWVKHICCFQMPLLLKISLGLRSLP